MSFFSTPPGYKPADSLTLSLATAVGVMVIYSGKIGPVADVQASQSGDSPVNASIKKAGWEALLLVAGMTILSRDLNTTILGGATIILEHCQYLHAEMASPETGEIQVNPAAYTQAQGSPALAAVAG
jgi:hypothetical protein